MTYNVVYGEYIYLVQERESMRCNDNVFKIGRTSQEPNKRMKGYPNNSRLLLTVIVNDSINAETELKRIFRNKFKLRNDIGDEYFEGDPMKMMRIIIKYFQENYVYTAPSEFEVRDGKGTKEPDTESQDDESEDNDDDIDDATDDETEDTEDNTDDANTDDITEPADPDSEFATMNISDNDYDYEYDEYDLASQQCGIPIRNEIRDIKSMINKLAANIEGMSAADIKTTQHECTVEAKEKPTFTFDKEIESKIDNYLKTHNSKLACPIDPACIRTSRSAVPEGSTSVDSFPKLKQNIISKIIPAIRPTEKGLEKPERTIDRLPERSNKPTKSDRFKTSEEREFISRKPNGTSKTKDSSKRTSRQNVKPTRSSIATHQMYLKAIASMTNPRYKGIVHMTKVGDNMFHIESISIYNNMKLVKNIDPNDVPLKNDLSREYIKLTPNGLEKFEGQCRFDKKNKKNGKFAMGIESFNIKTFRGCPYILVKFFNDEV